MYDLKPRALFAHRRVMDQPLAMARLERMLSGLGKHRDDVTWVTERDMDAIAEVAGATDTVTREDIIRGGHGRFRQGRMRQEVGDDPVIVFNTFVWDPAQRVPQPKRYAHPMAQRTNWLLCGAGDEFAWSRRDLWGQVSPGGFVCQGGDGMHTLNGCVHKCDYCGDGLIVSMMLDLEDYCTHLEQHFRDRPNQKLYRWDLFSDQICFEPEYGGTEIIGDCFRRNDRYLLLYTKSNNVDHLFDLPYQDHVLINWTLSAETMASQIERGTPSLAERIEAMRRCQEHGYTIRAGFTPIIPVGDWRQEATEMIELLFSQCQPEVLRLWVISMMEADELDEIAGDLLDPFCRQRMWEAEEEMRTAHHAPFPIDVRTMIYEHYLDEIKRVSPGTPVALCTEHPQSWERLQHKLEMAPGKMFCCCGGTSVPGSWQGPLVQVETE